MESLELDMESGVASKEKEGSMKSGGFVCLV